MAQIYNKLYVDVRQEVTAIVTAVQKEANSRFLDVYLKDNGLPINLTGHEVRIYGKKFDGTEIYNNGEISEGANGRCQFELTDQALALAQDLEVQIVIYYNNVQILQSFPFTIHVKKSLISTNAIESSNEYGALVVLYQNLYEAYDLMTTMVRNIGVPGEIAEQLTIDTMWDAWEYLCNYVSEDLTTLIQNALNNNSVDGVMQRIGNATDTGATDTTGTVMGKLNGVFGEISQSSDKIVTDNNILKACTNYTRLTRPNLPMVETEILNVSGEGFVQVLSVRASAAGYTTTMKVYIDDELFFDCGNYGTASKALYFGLATDDAISLKFDDLTKFVNGNTSSVTSYTPNLLRFKESLRVVVCATASETNDVAYVYYGLVG